MQTASQRESALLSALETSWVFPGDVWRRGMLLTLACLLIGAISRPSLAESEESETWFQGAGVTLASDYLFRGISQTSEDPAFQPSVDFALGSWSLGLWASNVDFGEGSTADAEIDLLLGWAFDFGHDVTVSVTAAYYAYVGERSSDYAEALVGVEWKWLSLTASLAPDYFGTGAASRYVGLDVTLPPVQGVEITVHVGASSFEDGAGQDDYWDASLALGHAFGPLYLEVLGSVTDLDDDPLASERVVLSATWSF